MNCFLLGWSEKIVSKFRINILLQHRELYTTDLQYLAVESFQIKVLTKAVLFGRRFGRVFYISNECVAFLLVLPLVLDAPWWILFLFGILFALCFYTTRELLTLEGRALNRTLGHTARNVFLFAAVLSLLFVYVGSSL